jgi:single-strand DNA-binding protein
MNKVQLHGFTGKQPEVKTLESGKKLAKFTLATQSYRKDTSGNKITDWHNCVVWEKLADLCEKYVRKGSELIVEGEISYRDYTGTDGVKKYFTEIIGNSIEFCGKKETKSKPANKEGIAQKSTDVESQIRNGDFVDDNAPF